VHAYLKKSQEKLLACRTQCFQKEVREKKLACRTQCFKKKSGKILACRTQCFKTKSGKILACRTQCFKTKSGKNIDLALKNFWPAGPSVCAVSGEAGKTRLLGKRPPPNHIRVEVGHRPVRSSDHVLPASLNVRLRRAACLSVYLSGGLSWRLTWHLQHALHHFLPVRRHFCSPFRTIYCLLSVCPSICLMRFASHRFLSVRPSVRA
jgi:hypothetical protein